MSVYEMEHSSRADDGWPSLSVLERRLSADLHELRGKDLACWCKPGEPCHADVLIEVANQERAGEGSP